MGYLKKLKVKYLDNYSGPKGIEIPRVGDIGIDIYSAADYKTYPGNSILVDTGIAFEIPNEYWIQILDRSSMSESFHVMAGVIDPSYRGEIKVRMFCHTDKDLWKGFSIGYPEYKGTVDIKAGDKIAQMVIRKNYNNSFVVEDLKELGDTDRGSGGFGSTGK